MALHRPAAADRDRALAMRPQLHGATPTPRDRMPDHGLPPATARQVCEDELLLDARTKLNLASFVTTWMEPDAAALFNASADKNLVDRDEYPRTAELERRCVAMLADLWHAEPGEPVGTSTTGSSEACMLGGLALLRRWRARGGEGRPNLVLGANCQVCWEKFCRYWDVEPRLVEVGDGATCLTPEKAAARCDERTIGVVAILGSTFDGVFEDVAGICGALDELAAGGGPDVSVHVDGASGAMVAPFTDPDLVWDFQLERVASINTSGHKYGLVYPGLGWVLWRDAAALPSDLVFDVDYLGGTQSSFSLTFSRPGAQVVAQYFQLLRLGRDGYARVHLASRATAQRLAAGIEALSAFTLVSDGSHLPVVAFRMADAAGRRDVYEVSDALRAHGWIVPAYPMPPALSDTHVLRVVVRNGFSDDLADVLVAHLHEAASGHGSGGATGRHGAPFHH